MPSSIQPDAPVPVLVWIHGGGFTTGSKDGNYSATGLFKRSAAPIIYVSLNYRLVCAPLIDSRQLTEFTALEPSDGCLPQNRISYRMLDFTTYDLPSIGFKSTFICLEEIPMQLRPWGRVLEQDRYYISSQHTAERKTRLHFNRYDT